MVEKEEAENNLMDTSYSTKIKIINGLLLDRTMQVS